ncbi:unnamed protein product [Darwinula stevensoni]|uniref:Oligopeptidase A n=1 Tax=Darwinula stevensoni TaxID=69355 RepID=A0A7R9AH69_9CRUS|nr:unnamed protein product [Darwinula stevensoni]CAG0905313.1 unnamed protein product [Darwinula stevensoni]
MKSLLNAVVDTPELREVYAQVQPKLTDFWTRLGQNMAIFKKYQQLDSLARKDDIVLDAAQQKAIHNALLDFRLSGAELAQPEQQRLLEIKTRQAELSRNFSDHCLDANNAYRYVVHDADEVLGIPEDALTQAADLAKTHDQTGWMFTLQFPSYFPVMQYAQNRALRETLYKAYVTRASELAAQYAGGELDWDNTPLMKEILALRQEEARLLGFDNYAQLSLKPKMADTPEQVIAFLEDMSQKARPFALQDYAQVEALAKDMGIDTVQPWDLTFVSEILREKQYSFSEQEVKQYFTESKVLQGLFATVEQLFGVRLQKAAGTTWHPDAHAYQIVDQQGQVIAHFYLDLYARQGGYAAGYYSYKWAEVLSSDVFGAFEEAAQSGAPLVNPSVGAKYRQEILAVGGSRPALESFIAFRGREPSPDALLRHSGMAA